MTPSENCTQCGASLPPDAPADFCPVCLASRGAPVRVGSSRWGSAPRRWEPPTAEELQVMLPQYEIVAMLGRGGMGAVYQGRQISLDRPVAIKILSAELEENDSGFAQRFKNEARAMGKLNHPGIVTVHDFGETHDGLLYIVMEYVEGTDVARMISSQKRLHTEHAMAITAHVCDALAYAHERGIIHRDIKPANIMVGYDGAVKVADFGLAKLSADGQTAGLTQSGMAMGTMHYMAPETMMLGVGSVDRRADLYAVGVMLYEMLTGRLPQGMFELPSMQAAGLDPRYDGIIAKALRHDREVRYQNAEEMRADLDAILTRPVVKVAADAQAAPAALPTQARPQRPGGQPARPILRGATPPPPKKSRMGLILGGLGAIAAAVIALLAWQPWKKPAPAPAPSGGGAVAKRQTTGTGGATITITSSDPVNILKLELGQPRLYDSNPLRVIEKVAPELAGWQFTSIPQRRRNSFQINVTKAGVIYAFGEYEGNHPTREQFLGADASRWEPADGEIEGRIMGACYKRKVTPGETIALRAFELELAAGSIAVSGRQADLPPAASPVSASKGQPFVNSLGMKFVPVPIIGGPTNAQRVLFSVWHTRVQDYEAFVKETRRDWPKPDFEQGPAHPAVELNWEDAQAFCQWLTARDHAARLLPAEWRYSLPSDHEWSCAVGVGEREDAAKLPVEKSDKIEDVFPWGTQWPPPKGAGNYAGEELRPSLAAGKYGYLKDVIPGYNDGFVNTSPVGSFAANRFGLFDMGGNVWQWCEDWFDAPHKDRVLRGASWHYNDRGHLLSSYRHHSAPGTRIDFGFRCVLARAFAPPAEGAGGGPPAAAIPPAVAGGVVPARGDTRPTPPAATLASTPKPLSDMAKWLAQVDGPQQEAFQKQVAKPFEAGVADLRARYLAALDADIARASAASQLAEALVWRTERQAFEKARNVAEDDAGTPAGVKALRASFRQQLARLDQDRTTKAKALHAPYDAILAQNQTLLTQRQRLDDALLLKNKRNEIARAWLGPSSIIAVGAAGSSSALVAPAQVPAGKAAGPKKVILVTITTGYRHSCIPIARKTILKLAETSGSFAIVDECEQPNINGDSAALSAGIKSALEKLSPANLRARGIDAVIFANTSGTLPLPDADGFVKWIEEGHAFVGTHAASDTFHQFPGYLDMLQGEFQTHGPQVSAEVVAGDTKHPANGGIGSVWNIKQEEIYRFKGQDPAKVHSLWFFRHDPNAREQAGFFPVSWCRLAGQGRVFYTSLGHREDLWSDDPSLPARVNSVETSKQFQAHFLGGIKWALGLAEGSAAPNPDVK